MAATVIGVYDSLTIGRTRPALLLAFDITAALALTGLVLIAASESAAPVWQAVAAALLIGAPIALRRRYPVPVYLIVVGATALVLITGVVPSHAVVGAEASAAVALYSVATGTPRAWSLPLLAGGVLVMAATALFAPARTGGEVPARVEAIVFVSIVLIGAWTIGMAVRARRAYAEHVAAQRAEAAAEDERVRIARELHDIVAHNMSLIAVKASVAGHLGGELPDTARETLDTIALTAREALTEMRQVLGVLRSAEPDLTPAPGLAGIPDLADHARAAGVTVDLAVTEVELPDGLAVSVYRIVQESLTNVVKHAAPTRCRVTVDAEPRAVTVSVIDDGGPGNRLAPTETGPGHGLPGMRERVAVYGGTFESGSRPGGGFEVLARLPWGTGGGSA